MSYAYVKYVKDNQKQIVPSSFIKDFDESKFTRGMKGSVFWSSNEDETPRDIVVQQGQIMNVDEAMEKGKVFKTAVAGYYNAEILLLGDSEEDVNKKIDGKRVQTPSEKGGLLIEDKKTQKHEKANSGKQKGSKKDEIKKTSTNANVKNLLKRGSKSAKNLESCSDDDDDEEVGPTKKFKREIENLKELNRSLKRKNISLTEKMELLEKDNSQLTDKNKLLESENSQLKELNFEYQKQNMRKIPIHSTPVKVTIPKTPTRSSERLKKNKETIAAANSVSKKLVYDTEPGSSKTSEADSSFKSRSSDNDCVHIEPENCSPTKMEKKNRSPDNEEDFKLSDDKYEAALTGVTAGLGGDSLFAKNMARAIFGRTTLINSSVKGDPRPPLPAKKI